jgi:hypothetical protein
MEAISGASHPSNSVGQLARRIRCVAVVSNPRITKKLSGVKRY